MLKNRGTLKMSYEIGDSVLYKGTEVSIDSIGGEFCEGSLLSIYKIKLSNGLILPVTTSEIIPIKKEIEVIALIPGGFIQDSGNYLAQVKFGHRMEKNYPQEVIDHWLAWATNEEEVV